MMQWPRMLLFSRLALVAALTGSVAHADDSLSPATGYRSAVGSDLRWLGASARGDALELVQEPVHAAALVRSPVVYQTLLGAALLGTAFGLDRSARERARKMPDASASHLERGAYGLLLGATGWIYARGLQNQDEGMREIALTSAEGMAVGGLVTAAAKFAFGRARPNENRGPFAFGQHGRSFASGEATPAFALAAGISEYGSNHWYVALPAYGAAAAVGLARMGEDAHWLSDVVGSALIGVASTKLLLQLHRQRAGHGHRVQIIPLLSPTSVGVLVYREWGGAAPDAERTPARGRNSRAGFFGAARGEH